MRKLLRKSTEAGERHKHTIVKGVQKRWAWLRLGKPRKPPVVDRVIDTVASVPSRVSRAVQKVKIWNTKNFVARSRHNAVAGKKAKSKKR